MEKDQKKKEYEKPKVTRITLDAKCAVLGFCKQRARAADRRDRCQDGSPPPARHQGS